MIRLIDLSSKIIMKFSCFVLFSSSCSCYLMIKINQKFFYLLHCITYISLLNYYMNYCIINTIKIFKQIFFISVYDVMSKI